MKIINVRGCNGSGKTTLLRSLVKRYNANSNVIVRSCPEFREVDRDGEIAVHKSIPFTFVGQLAILGDYMPRSPGEGPEPTTAGCDRVKTQAATKNALEWAMREPLVECVLFEGVVVSTIYGPWRDWAEPFGGMTWAFLDTPLDVCLNRIQARNGGKPIKEDQVADKHATIERVALKAQADGSRVVTLRWESALSDLIRLIQE
jgi:hypothetical protein